MRRLLGLPISELANHVRLGDVTAEAVATASLDEIANTSSLNAFVHISRARVLTAARAIDKKRVAGAQLGTLAGVPVAIKDAICTLDFPTTCGSRILCRANEATSQGWQSPFDA